MNIKHSLYPLLISVILFSGCATNQPQKYPSWAMGPFIRPDGVNPVISPNAATKFFCPMTQDSIGWEESDTFNPAATVKDGKIYVLYRAEDNSATDIGKRTSRIGLAESADGVTMKRSTEPVLFPAEVEKPGHTWTTLPETEQYTEVLDRIDFVFFRGAQVKLLKVDILGENSTLSDSGFSNYPSDHRAVMSTFVIN